MSTVLVIQVDNPYHDRRYQTTDLNLKEWEEHLKNINLGNIQTIAFHDSLSGNFVSLSPRNFASIEVFEMEVA